MPPTKSALNKKDKNNDEDFDPDKSVAELPEKVDKFVNYVDDVYFGGRLGNDAKAMLKADEIRKVFNAEDASGTSPAVSPAIRINVKSMH